MKVVFKPFLILEIVITQNPRKFCSPLVVKLEFYPSFSSVAMYYHCLFQKISKQQAEIGTEMPAWNARFFVGFDVSAVSLALGW